MRKLLLVTGLIGVAGCSTHVKLHVTNPTLVAQVPRAEVRDDNDLVKETQALGTVQPGADVRTEFDVKHGQRVEVVSRLPNQPDIFQSGPVSVGSKPDPRSIDVVLGVTGHQLDDKVASSVIKAAFSDVGPQMPGYRGLSVNDALQTWYGALVVVQPIGKDGRVPEHALLQFKPGQFAPKISDIKYPAGFTQETVRLSKQASASASAAFAAFALASQGESADVLEVDWNFQNFGMVQRDDGAWNYVAGLNALKDDEKKILAETLLRNPGATAYYVDTMYVFQNATYSVKKATKVATSGKFDAASIITAEGGWTFEGVNATTNSRQNSVLNVVGIPLTISVVEGADVKRGKPAETELTKRLAPIHGLDGGAPNVPPDWSKVLLTAHAGRPRILTIPANAK